MTDRTRRRYNQIAPFYDILEYPVERLVYGRWRRELWSGVAGPEILELGIGTGKNIPFHPPGMTVTGIDFSPAMLSRACRRARECPAEQMVLHLMDASALSFDACSFDSVVATFVLCSVPDPVKALKEALRVTRPGGRLRLLEHQASSIEWLARLMRLLDPPVHFLTGVHIGRNTATNVAEAGWTIEDDRPLDGAGVFRMIVASKPPGISPEYSDSSQGRVSRSDVDSLKTF